MRPTSRIVPVVGTLVCAMLVAGPAIAATNVFYEDFTSTNAGLGCTVGNGINGYNGWTAQYDATALELAHCDVGDWPGDATRKYMAILSIDSVLSDISAWAKHSFGTVTNQWDASAEFFLLCDQNWGSDMFALLELVGYLDVGFKNGGYKVDVRDGAGYANDQGNALDCGAAYSITVTMASPTANNYDLSIVRISNGTSYVSGNYDTASTTTPSEIRFGVGVGTGSDQGGAGFDEIRVRKDLP